MSHVNEAASAPIAFAFIMRSAGELHCLLPILAQAKLVEPNLGLVLVFKDQASRARLIEDAVYSAILAELGAELIYAHNLWRYVLARRDRVRIIFKEFGPTLEGSVPTLLKRLCPNASLVLFPHAYAIYGSPEAAAAESSTTRADFAQDMIDAVLLSSELDVEPWKKKLHERAIRVVGATGHSEWWGTLLRRHALERLKGVQDDAGGKKIVFLTTRGPHHLFLSDENYRDLVKQAIEVILSRPDVLIVLKPHPREDIAQLKALIASYPSDRLKLTTLNTLALASISAVTVSFWSSALLDSLAAGTPSIEFHRFHVPLPQTVLDADGQLASLYTTLGLALRASTSEALSAALDLALAQRDVLLARERAALARCFPDNEARLETLRGVLRDLLKAPARRTSAGSTALSLLRIAKLSARDLLEELRERRRHDD